MRKKPVCLALLVLVGSVGLVLHLAAPQPILRTLTLVGQPYAITIDSRTRRAFILGSRVDSTPGSPTGFRGYLAMLDSATGALLHTSLLGPNPTDLLLDLQTDRLFVTDIVDGSVRTLDARTGVLVRTVAVGPMDPHDLQRIALDSRRNLVFVSASGLLVLDGRTGALLQTVAASGDSVAVDERTGQAFVAHYGANSIDMVDPQRGQILRTLAVGPAPLHLYVAPTARRLLVQGEQGVSVLDTATGQLVRATTVGAARFAQVLVDDATGRVYVTDPDRATVSTLDVRTGAVLHTAAGASDVAPPALVRRCGRLLVMGSTKVSIFDARRGTRIRTLAIAGHPWAMVVDEQRGLLYVSSSGRIDPTGALRGTGSISVVDACRGILLHTLTVDRTAGPVALDPDTHQLFVIDRSMPVLPSDAWGWLPHWLRQRLPLLPPAPTQPATTRGSVRILNAPH